MMPDLRWLYMGAAICGLTLLAALVGYAAK